VDTKPIRVLAVDHNALLRDELSDLIRLQPDMELIGIAGSADEAVRLFAQFRPDVTLLDLELPSGTGLHAIARIREIDAGACILGLLTYEWDQPAAAALRGGARMCLAKDHLTSDLPCLIREWRREK